MVAGGVGVPGQPAFGHPGAAHLTSGHLVSAHPALATLASVLPLELSTNKPSLYTNRLADL